MVTFGWTQTDVNLDKDSKTWKREDILFTGAKLCVEKSNQEYFTAGRNFAFPKKKRRILFAKF